MHRKQDSIYICHAVARFGGQHCVICNSPAYPSTFSAPRATMPAILPNVAWRGRYCASRRFGFVAVAFDPSSAPFHAARTLAVALGGRMQPVPCPICHQNVGKASRRSIRPLREGGG